MKLFYSPTSPYVRKVLVTAMEIGLDAKIERLSVQLPNLDPALSAENPLGKVPTLVSDGGETLFDSPVICEYLDSLHDGVKLFPPVAGARWRALRWQALGDGALDAIVSVRYEVMRSENEQSPAWIAKQKLKAENALNVLEEEAALLEKTPITVGHIAIGCALGFMDFRFADDAWRNGRAQLAAWFDGFAARPSMTATVPKEKPKA